MQTPLWFCILFLFSLPSPLHPCPSIGGRGAVWVPVSCLCPGPLELLGSKSHDDTVFQHHPPFFL